MTANEALNNYFKSLSRSEKRNLSCQFIIKLEVSPAIITNWRCSATPIKSIYRREIIKIIGKDIFENVTD